MVVSSVPSNLVSKFMVNRSIITSEIDQNYPRRYVDIKSLNIKLSNYRTSVYRIANKMPAKKTKSTKEYKWLGYANVNIPSDRIPDAEEYIKDQNQVHQHLITAFASGLTVKLYFDDKSDSYKTVFTDHNPESPNYGYAMSSYGSDWFTALASGLFKHFVLVDCDWTSSVSTTKRSFG